MQIGLLTLEAPLESFLNLGVGEGTDCRTLDAVSDEPQDQESSCTQSFTSTDQGKISKLAGIEFLNKMIPNVMNVVKCQFNITGKTVAAVDPAPDGEESRVEVVWGGRRNPS